jgi:hypothetical protein
VAAGRRSGLKICGGIDPRSSNANMTAPACLILDAKRAYFEARKVAM